MIYVVKHRETIASVSSSIGFTSTYIPPTSLGVTYAFCQAIDANVRICLDGTVPTSSKGIKILQNGTFEVWGSNALTNFRVIDDGATAKLEVIYMGVG